MEVAPENGIVDDNSQLDTLYSAKTRETKIMDLCDHGTHSQENELDLRGELIAQKEDVKDVSKDLRWQIILTLSFCAIEFCTGIWCASIAMLADSYHMAADVMALIVAYTCIKIATRPSTRHGYGWVRAETLGGFINGIFMCTVCLTVIQEAIGRFLNVHLIKSPMQVLLIGFIGLIINIIGICNLNGHGHSHGGGGHGHSHAEDEPHIHMKSKKHHGHSHENMNEHHGEGSECHDANHSVDNRTNHGASDSAQPEALTRLLENEEAEEHIERRLSGVNNQNPFIATVDSQMTPYGTHIASEVLTAPVPNHSHSHNKSKKKKRELNVNIHGVWLHLLSDAFGSIIVMLSAACVLFFPDWFVSAYLDPGLSMILAILMGITATVLVRTSAKKLLRRAPKGLDIEVIKTDLCRIVGVSKVEKLSVWTLCGQRIIASAHVNVCHPAVFTDAAYKIKKYFHDLGVHSTTIEPTFEVSCMEQMSIQAVKKIPSSINTVAPATLSTENETSDISVIN
uniref:Zinc/cadmium resistance protein n=1 Tax=Caenorhabditis tropicalis TaxID=1561998 RepID=A0A1I7TJ33_9PELO